MFVPNFKILGQVVAEKSLTKKFFGKKEKWTNKGTDKPYTVQLVIPNVCTKFQNPKHSSSWEIFDEKKVYTQTNTHTEKAKTIYPLYTSYTGGIITL